MNSNKNYQKWGNNMDDPVYTTEELIELLKVSRRTLQNWRDRGTIEFSQINGKIFYRASAINKMLDQNLITNSLTDARKHLNFSKYDPIK